MFSLVFVILFTGVGGAEPWVTDPLPPPGKVGCDPPLPDRKNQPVRKDDPSLPYQLGLVWNDQQVYDGGGGGLVGMAHNVNARSFLLKKKSYFCVNLTFVVSLKQLSSIYYQTCSVCISFSE